MVFEGPGDPRSLLFCDVFQVLFLGTTFSVFLCILCVFWRPWAPKWAPLGYPGGTILGQIRDPGPARVPKGLPGGQKGHFWVPLGRILGGIFDDFS